MKFAISLFVVLLVLLHAQMVCAFTEEGAIVQYSLFSFDFQEFDDKGEKLLSEKGMVSGVKAQLKYTFDDIYVGGQFGFFGNKIGLGNFYLFNGEVNYDGQTQDGDPHKTTTIETVMNGSFEIGRIYESWRPHDYAVIYIGVGYHRWIRDIQNIKRIDRATGKLITVVGLFETYSWWYTSLGARGYLFRTNKFFLMAEINLLRTAFPKMIVDFKGTKDASGKENKNQELKLGKHWGGKIALPMRYRITPVWYINVEPYLEAWDLGRSPDVTVDDAGFASINEPRSTTQFLGINIGAQYLW